MAYVLLAATMVVGGCGARTADPPDREGDASPAVIADAGASNTRLPQTGDARPSDARMLDAPPPVARGGDPAVDAGAARPVDAGSRSRAEVISLAVSPGDAVIDVGATLELKVVAYYADGAAADVSTLASYIASDSAVVELAGRVVMGRAAGKSVVTISFGGATVTATIGVRPAPTVTTITVTPSSASCPVSGSVSFRAVATTGMGVTEDVTTRALWSASMGSVLLRAGTAQCLFPGTVLISAAFGAARGEATLVVQAPTVNAYTIEGSRSLQVNGDAVFLLRADYSDGSAGYPSAVAWESSDSSVVQVLSEPFTYGGQAHGLVRGYAVLTARVDGAAVATIAVAVSGGVLQSLAITPTSVTVTYPASATVSVIGTYSDGIQADVTNQVSWQQDTPVVDVQNGSVYPAAAGTGLLKAEMSNSTVSATVPVTVLPGQPTGLTLSGDVIVPVGIAEPISVSAVYADGNSLEVTSVATWNVVDPTVASLSGGRCTGLKRGTTVFNATLGNLRSDDATVTVSAAVLLSIEFTATHLALNVEELYGIAVTGTFDDATQEDVTRNATFTTGNANIAVVVNRPGVWPVLRAVGPGTTSLTATVGAVSTNTTVTVNR